MSRQLSIIATALIPATSVISFAVYLVSHPESPARRLSDGRVALPTTRGEGLEGEKDAFDLDDDLALGDGAAIEPDRFWASQWRRKIALLITLLVAFAANIALLVLSILDNGSSNQPYDPVLPPALLVPSHAITIVLAIWFLSQSETSTHWPTTVHLALGISVQFVVLAIIALLPHEPFPTRSRLLDHYSLESVQAIPLLRYLLPVLHIAPLLIILYIRRGPPLYVPLDRIYPPQVIDAVPIEHSSLDSTQRNVCEEVEATIPEYLLFGFVTNVVKRGYKAESMNVWDLPVLTKDMREYCASCADVKVLSLATEHSKRCMDGTHGVLPMTRDTTC